MEMDSNIPVIARTAREHGLTVYLVGGAVRDMIMEVPVLDWDFTVEGDPEQLPVFGQALAVRLGGEYKPPSQFHTFKVVAECEYEFAPVRTETYPVPASLPVVQVGAELTISDDLGRRDFSINAMAVELVVDGVGRFYDPFGGAEDILNRSIRVLHSGSFVDDPTRIFRLFRFANRGGFEIHPDTLQAVRKSLTCIRELTGTRIMAELRRVLSEPNAAATLHDFIEYGVFAEVHAFDGLREAVDCALSGDYDVQDGFVAALGYAAQDADALAARLILPNRSIRLMVDAFIARERLTEHRSGIPMSELDKLVGRLDELSVRVASCALGDGWSGSVESYLLRRDVKPHLTARDLLALGVPRGPEIGKMLSVLRDAHLDGHVSRADEKDIVEQTKRP